MGLIASNVLSGIADRIATQAGLFKVGFNAARASGTPYYQRVHVGVGTPIGDYDVEYALINPANTIDTNTFSGTFFNTVYSQLISAIETHVLAKNSPTFDSFLNISGVNVHPDFDDVYYRVKATHLLARNVFFSDPNMLVATFTSTGSGTGTYASVAPVGTAPDSKYVPGTTNYAAAKLIVVPTSDVGGDIQINLRLVKENMAGSTTTDSDNIVIVNGTTSGTQFVVKAGAAMLNVNNIVVAGGDGADVFNVYAVRERDIAL
jgi:hypothetical protein